MTGLILTTDASAAGAVMDARPGDLAIAIERRLVWGPLLSEAQSEAFFAAHTSQGQGLHWLDDTPSWRLEEFGARDLGSIGRVVDAPVPNSQLMLLWLLDYWRPKATVAPRLVMRDVDFLIGATERTRLEKLDVPAVEISGDHLAAASLAWQAYRAPTPQAWSNLLSADLGLLPQLGPCAGAARRASQPRHRRRRDGNADSGVDLPGW